MGRRSFQRLSERQEAKAREIKLKLCAKLRRSMSRPGWSSGRAAAVMGTSQAVVSHIWCDRVEKLTFNQLFRFLILLELHLDVLIST